MKALFTTNIQDMTSKQLIGYCVLENILMVAVVLAVFCTKQYLGAEAITLGNNLFHAICFAAPLATAFDGIAYMKQNRKFA